MRRYWSFYWPLLLTSLVMQLENQFQNRTLAQYAADGRELAIFANASSAFQSANALLIFLPQLVTVMAIGSDALRRCRHFAFWFGIILALPLLFMANTAPGGQLLNLVLGVPPEILEPVQNYLQWLAPLVIAQALIFHNVGHLLLMKCPKTITRLNLLHMAVLVGLLQGGYYGGWESVVTLAVATITANLVHWLASEIAVRQRPTVFSGKNVSRPADFSEMWAFYWPMALTGVLFSVSRPIIYRYVNFLPHQEALATLAALRVAFDAGFIFQAPVNQLRHLFTSFPESEQKQVRKFSLYVAGGYTLLTSVVAFTPLSRVFFARLVHVDGEVLSMAVGAFAVLSLNPLVVAIRNIYHGELINRRHTGGMALGALLRAGIIWLLSMACYYGGVLNYLSGAALMLSGFGIEAFTSWLSARKLRRAENA